MNEMIEFIQATNVPFLVSNNKMYVRINCQSYKVATLQDLKNTVKMVELNNLANLIQKIM